MIRKFILRVSFFLSIILIAYIILGYYVYESRNTYHIKKEILDSKHNDVEILILGNSHALFGVNPYYFKKNTINLANASQSLYYDLLIADKCISQMPHLKAIAINLSFFTFKYQLDDNIENWRRNYYYYYWGMEPMNSDFKYYKEMVNLPLRMIKRKRGMLTSELIDSLGFQKATGERNFYKDVSGLITRVDIYAEMYYKGTSEKNLYLLNEIFKMAKERGIRLFFFMTPKHNLYIENFDEKIIIDFEDQIASSELISKITFFDERSNDDFSNEYFTDFDHLSVQGAKKFSLLLSDHIEKSLFLNKSSRLPN